MHQQQQNQYPPRPAPTDSTLSALSPSPSTMSTTSTVSEATIRVDDDDDNDHRPSLSDVEDIFAQFTAHADGNMAATNALHRRLSGGWRGRRPQPAGMESGLPSQSQSQSHSDQTTPLALPAWQSHANDTLQPVQPEGFASQATIAQSEQTERERQIKLTRLRHRILTKLTNTNTNSNTSTSTDTDTSGMMRPSELLQFRGLGNKANFEPMGSSESGRSNYCLNLFVAPLDLSESDGKDESCADTDNGTNTCTVSVTGRLLAEEIMGYVADQFSRTRLRLDEAEEERLHRGDQGEGEGEDEEESGRDTVATVCRWIGEGLDRFVFKGREHGEGSVSDSSGFRRSGTSSDRDRNWGLRSGDKSVTVIASTSEAATATATEAYEYVHEHEHQHEYDEVAVRLNHGKTQCTKRNAQQSVLKREGEVVMLDIGSSEKEVAGEIDLGAAMNVRLSGL